MKGLANPPPGPVAVISWVAQFQPPPSITRPWVSPALFFSFPRLDIGPFSLVRGQRVHLIHAAVLALSLPPIVPGVLESSVCVLVTASVSLRDLCLDVC